MGDRFPVVEGKTGYYYSAPSQLAGLARRAARGELRALDAAASQKIIRDFDVGVVARKVYSVYQSVL
jgi:hypothetical protein